MNAFTEIEAFVLSTEIAKLMAQADQKQIPTDLLIDGDDNSLTNQITKAAESRVTVAA